MTDLIHLLGKLVTTRGEILIPGLNELVAPLTDEERKRYEVLDYSVAASLLVMTAFLFLGLTPVVLL